MKNGYIEDGVEYLPCIGEPESIKTRKQGRFINESLYKKDTPLVIRKLTKLQNGSLSSSLGLRKRAKVPESIIVNNCNRIINFKYSSPKQKELAKKFLETRQMSLANWIKKITRTLSLQYNKDF